MESTPLSYLLTNPGAFGMALARPLGILLLLLVAVFFLRPHPSGRRLTWLRSIAFVAAIAAFAGLQVVITLPSHERAIIAAVDVSDSVGDGGLEWAKRLLAQTSRSLAPGEELLVLKFADASEVVRATDEHPALEALERGHATAATNLEQAIDDTLALFAPDRERILLLLTDGNETSGDSRTRIPRLQAAGVTVHVSTPPESHLPDVRVSKLTAPPIVSSERIAPLRLVAHNNGPQGTALLNLYTDGQLTDSSVIELAAGLNTFDLATKIRGNGAHRLRAELVAPEDPTPANNHREVAITVRGATRAMVVSRRDHSPIALSLRQRGFEVDVTAPSALPRHWIGYEPYHLVILEDLRARHLAGADLAPLEHFVRESGGGLIVAGGGDTFGDRALKETPLARMLPVTMEPRRPKPGKREPLALFLVIDRSNSMGYNSRIGTLRDGEKLRYAKTAALEVIGQLKDQDLVGVIAFDSQPTEVAPLRPLTANRARLKKLIPRLIENGGTDFFDALHSAREQLSRSRVNRRHVVLLTDGDTNRAGHGEYRELTKQMADASISVTTIRIGDNTVNLRLLQSISKGTGGSFHHVADARKLPELMLRDATRALTPLRENNQEFFPTLGRRNQLLRGLDEELIPPLVDYAYAKPKPGAEVVLQVTRLERRDPLLTVWHYGLGRIAALTASPATDAEAWLGWAQMTQFWGQLAHWTARQHAGGDLAVSASHVEDKTELTVRAFDSTADNAVLSGRLHLDRDRSIAIDISAHEPRVFRARVDELAAGRYPLTIIRRTAEGSVFEIDQIVTVPANDGASQREHQNPEPNMKLLQALAKGTGGTLNSTSRDLARRDLGERVATYPLDWLLVPLAMSLFLADIALRRVYALGKTA